MFLLLDAHLWHVMNKACGAPTGGNQRLFWDKTKKQKLKNQQVTLFGLVGNSGGKSWGG